MNKWWDIFLGSAAGLTIVNSISMIWMYFKFESWIDNVKECLLDINEILIEMGYIIKYLVGN